MLTALTVGIIIPVVIYVPIVLTNVFVYGSDGFDACLQIFMPQSLYYFEKDKKTCSCTYKVVKGDNTNVNNGAKNIYEYELSFGYGNEISATDFKLSKDEQIICKDCAEKQHAVTIALGKSVEDYKRKLFD